MRAIRQSSSRLARPTSLPLGSSRRRSTPARRSDGGRSCSRATADTFHHFHRRRTTRRSFRSLTCSLGARHSSAMPGSARWRRDWRLVSLRSRCQWGSISLITPLDCSGSAWHGGSGLRNSTASGLQRRLEVCWTILTRRQAANTGRIRFARVTRSGKPAICSSSLHNGSQPRALALISCQTPRLVDSIFWRAPRA